MLNFRRHCYDKPHRCPGWVGGGWKYPRPQRDVCPGGSFASYMYMQRFWQWRFHRCRECGTVAIPHVTRWLDPTWLWWWVRARVIRRQIHG